MLAREVDQAFRAFALIALLAFEIGSISPLSHTDSTNGLAAIYIDPPIGDRLSLTAMLTLPKRQKNKDWYATWIMLVANGDRNAVSFLQCGLIRWRGSGFDAVPFVAYRDRSGRFAFEQAGPKIMGRILQLEIVFSHGILRVKSGNRLYFNKPASGFFNIADSLYFQAGDEISRYGDHLSGEITDLWINDSKQRPAIVCKYTDSGLSFIEKNGGWVGSGTLRQSVYRSTLWDAPPNC